MMRERVKLLGPPESATVPSIVKPSSEVRRQRLKMWIRELWVCMLTRIRLRDLYVRLFKSCILVIKVCSHRDLHRMYSCSSL